MSLDERCTGPTPSGRRRPGAPAPPVADGLSSARSAEASQRRGRGVRRRARETTEPIGDDDRGATEGRIEYVVAQPCHRCGSAAVEAFSYADIVISSCGGCAHCWHTPRHGNVAGRPIEIGGRDVSPERDEWRPQATGEGGGQRRSTPAGIDGGRAGVLYPADGSRPGPAAGGPSNVAPQGPV